MTLHDNEKIEYVALAARGHDAERTWQMCWTASSLVACVALSWGIAARSAGLMLPVVFATAIGYYTMIRGRRQTRLVAGYMREFFEKSDNGPRWFTRLGRLEVTPAYSPNSDWLLTALANAMVVAAVALSWLYSSNGTRGELLAGIVSGLGVVFAFHSLSETAALHRSDYSAYWRQLAKGPAEVQTERYAATA